MVKILHSFSPTHVHGHSPKTTFSIYNTPIYHGKGKFTQQCFFYRQDPGMSPDGSIAPGASQPNTMPSGADTGMYSPNPQQQRFTLFLVMLIDIMMFITLFPNGNCLAVFPFSAGMIPMLISTLAKMHLLVDNTQVSSLDCTHSSRFVSH